MLRIFAQMLVSGFLLSVCLSFALAAPPVAGRNYTLDSAKSRQCMDDGGASTSPGNPIIQWRCHNGANQVWTLTAVGSNTYQITNKLDDLCLDVAGYSSAPAAKIDQYTCKGTTYLSQIWSLRASVGGGYELVSALSGLCVGLAGPSYSTEGVRLEQLPCSGELEQSWIFTAAGSATPPPLPGSAFYVSPGGLDSNSGSSPASPFQTLERAQAAMEASSSVKTTYLMGGIYHRTQDLMLTNYNDGGQSWLRYPGETPVLDGGGTVYEGIYIVASNVTIRGLIIQNFARSGIFAKYCKDLLIDSNTVLSITTPDWRTNILGSGVFMLRVQN